MGDTKEAPAAPGLSVDILIEDEAWHAVNGLEDLTRSGLLAALAVAGLSYREAEVCVLFTDDEEVRRLNAEYRGKDKPTNVLSFPAGGGPQVADAPVMLGDIVLARSVVEKEALQQGKPLANHLTHLIVHGMLHLAGFDHEQDDEAETMEALEIEALARLGLPNPYGHDRMIAVPEH